MRAGRSHRVSEQASASSFPLEFSSSQACKVTDMEQKEELAEFDESVPLTAEDEEGNVTTVMEATTFDGETLTQLEEALSQLTKG